MKQLMMRRKNIWLACLTGILPVLAFAGCGSGPGESESKMTSFTASESKADTAELFSVPKEQLAHVEIVPVQKGPLPRLLRLSGAVAFNAFETTPVFAAIGGPVREILVAPGQFVHAGQPLLTVTSPDYSAARSTYIKALDAFALSDKALHACEGPFRARRHLRGGFAAGGVRPQPGARGRGIFRGCLARAGPEGPGGGGEKYAPDNFGDSGSRAGIWGNCGTACRSGTIAAGGATQCFTISDTSTVWVLVNVYQSDLAFVHVGDAVEINTETYPDAFRGKISYIAPALDPTTRTLQARIVTENPGKKLKKDMYVTAHGARRGDSRCAHRAGRLGAARYRKHALRLCADRTATSLPGAW